MKFMIKTFGAVFFVVLVVLLAGDARAAHVIDKAGLLEQEQRQILEEKARDIEAEHQFGVYIFLIEDYFEYDPRDVFYAAIDIYKTYHFGYGSDKDGLMLLLSMRERDYSLITYGDRGNLTFNDEGREAMTKFFLDDFREDRWYSGLWDYLDWSEKYLEAEEAGNPYGRGNLPLTQEEWVKKTAINIAIILLLPLAVAGVWVWVLTEKMKSVARQAQASAYAEDGLTLIHHSDQYTHTTETRTKIPKNNSCGGGGGSRTSRSGGFSGTSGKF